MGKIMSFLSDIGKAGTNVRRFQQRPNTEFQNMAQHLDIIGWPWCDSLNGSCYVLTEECLG